MIMMVPPPIIMVIRSKTTIVTVLAKTKAIPTVIQIPMEKKRITGMVIQAMRIVLLRKPKGKEEEGNLHLEEGPLDERRSTILFILLPFSLSTLSILFAAPSIPPPSTYLSFYPTNPQQTTN